MVVKKSACIFPKGKKLGWGRRQNKEVRSPRHYLKVSILHRNRQRCFLDGKVKTKNSLRKMIIWNMQFKPQNYWSLVSLIIIFKKFIHNSFIFFSLTPSLGLKFKIWTGFTFFLMNFGMREVISVGWTLLSLDIWSGAI